MNRLYDPMRLNGLQVHMHKHHHVPLDAVLEKSTSELARAHSELNEMGRMQVFAVIRESEYLHVFGHRMAMPEPLARAERAVRSGLRYL